MNDRKTVTIAAAVLLAAPLVLFYFNRVLILHLVLILWVLAVIAGYLKYVKVQHEREKHLLMESLQRTASATLGHHRHDWMNDLQILYGYIRLGKHDKLIQSVERIKARMAEESKISKLGVPSLVYYLQSFREMNKSVQLDTHIEDELSLGSLLDQQVADELTEAVMDMIRIFQYAGRASWGESLKLDLSIYREGGEAVIRFEQEGTHSNPDTLWQNIEEALRGKHIYACKASEANGYELRMPCVNPNEVKACL
ncbi:hypothetical protein DCC85_16975 [Paenibacillus sp. CAA11]|uniref:Spo0B domain-containing protein n=1 Tax=Paenibacillus sp. CAA11 TaxID=1532905 RepID=UPI000D366789|nr:Spo0B domain-containing protein [Paenibacillus sp. CAA11]AWB45715.1 hypothetical protein DCC85_16975 [Paenibacillus sp. CAA11]